VKGASTATCTETACTTRLADAEDLWSVRCSTESPPDLGNWIKNEGCSVYANSLIETCAVEDLDTASDFCGLKRGLLFVSKEETESDCGRSSCQMNSRNGVDQHPWRV